MPLDKQTSRPAFAEASLGTGRSAPEARRSEMVAKDRPQPAPRPSPGFAQEVDRAAFDAAWDRERRDAQAHQERAARREAFKAMRRAEEEKARSRTFNRHAAGHSR